MTDPIVIHDFEKYAAKLAEQSRKHGREALSSRNYAEAYLIGFQSPEGWFAVRLSSMKGFCARQDFVRKPGPIPGSVCLSRLPSGSIITEVIKVRMIIAYNGDPPEQLSDFNKMMENFRDGKRSRKINDEN